MLAPPDGDYLIVAIADERAINWQNPAFLRGLAASADRITVTNSASQPPTLRVRRVP